MYVELSEVLVCPSCGPDANLVLAVDERDGRWVRSGTLACARCDARYPVRGGRLDLRPSGEREPASGPTPDPSGPSDPEEVAVEVAALLELQRRGGAVLLGPGLAPAAPRVASLAERAAILCLAEPAAAAGPGPADRGPAPPDGEDRVTRILTSPAAGLPVRGRRLAGIALWSPDVDRVEEAARALGAGGRLVGLRPSPEARRAAEGLDLEVLASESRAVVVSRPA